MAETVRLQMPGKMKYVSLLSVCLAEMLRHVDQVPDAERTVYNIQLAVHEGCANIVRHAYQRGDGLIDVNLTLDQSPRRLVIEMIDTGDAFNLADIQLPDLDSAQIGGYGIYLMRQLMDEVSYEARPGQNYWRLTKYL